MQDITIIITANTCFLFREGMPNAYLEIRGITWTILGIHFEISALNGHVVILVHLQQNCIYLEEVMEIAKYAAVDAVTFDLVI